MMCCILWFPAVCAVHVSGGQLLQPWHDTKGLARDTTGPDAATRALNMYSSRTRSDHPKSVLVLSTMSYSSPLLHPTQQQQLLQGN